MVAQYVAVNWRTKQVFNSTWPSASSAGTPFSFALNTADVVPGFVKGLTGVPVGSRVMLVIPPADGYGKTGQFPGGHQGDRHPGLRGGRAGGAAGCQRLAVGFSAPF